MAAFEHLLISHEREGAAGEAVALNAAAVEHSRDLARER
jgi:hypothetical protein